MSLKMVDSHPNIFDFISFLTLKIYLLSDHKEKKKKQSYKINKYLILFFLTLTVSNLNIKCESFEDESDEQHELNVYETELNRLLHEMAAAQGQLMLKPQPQIVMGRDKKRFLPWRKNKESKHPTFDIKYQLMKLNNLNNNNKQNTSTQSKV